MSNLPASLPSALRPSKSPAREGGLCTPNPSSPGTKTKTTQPFPPFPLAAATVTVNFKRMARHPKIAENMRGRLPAVYRAARQTGDVAAPQANQVTVMLF